MMNFKMHFEELCEETKRVSKMLGFKEKPINALDTKISNLKNDLIIVRQSTHWKF